MNNWSEVNMWSEVNKWFEYVKWITEVKWIIETEVNKWIELNKWSEVNKVRWISEEISFCNLIAAKKISELFCQNQIHYNEDIDLNEWTNV